MDDAVKVESTIKGAGADHSQQETVTSEMKDEARQSTDVSRSLDSHGGQQVLEAKAAQSDSVSSLLETESGVDALKKVARVNAADAAAVLMKDYDTKGPEEKVAIADAVAALSRD